MGAIITGMEIDRRRSEAAADRGRELDGGDDVRIGSTDAKSFLNAIVQVWQRPRGAVAADPVAADLRLDGDVLLHLVVPVVGPLRADEEGDHTHARLGARVVEVLARVDDLLEPAAERDLVALEEFEDVILLIRLELDLLGVGAEPDDPPADVDRAAVDVLADLLARVAADDEPAAVHHVAGHEVRVARAAERPGLHHLAAREPRLPCTTTSAPRIATPAIAPALPRTTTVPRTCCRRGPSPRCPPPRTAADR